MAAPDLIQTDYSAAELERRRPVWNAASDLWLDTELEPYNHRFIATTFLSSGYDIPALETIVFHEVAPVLWINLFSVAGEWAGFDQSWLEEQILKRNKRTFIKRIDQYFFSFHKKQVKNDWEKVLLLMKNGI